LKPLLWLKNWVGIANVTFRKENGGGLVLRWNGGTIKENKEDQL